MMWERRKFGLRAVLVSVVGLVSVSGLLCFVYFVITNHHGARNVAWVHIKMQSIERPSSHIAVLLQQSQVQVQAQFTRLKAIDSGWATWRTAKNTDSQLSIFAAITNESISKHTSQIKNINLIPMLPVVSTQSVEGSPYHQMINSLHHIILEGNYTTVKWLVMANDHTFIIPPNLQQFFTLLDPDRLIYTGNELKMQYKNRVLSFASGGAGAVMSHVVVKLMLVVWAMAEQQSAHLRWAKTVLVPKEESPHSGQFSCTADAIVADLRSTGVSARAVLGFLYQWKTADGGHVERLVCGETGSSPGASTRTKVLLRLSSRIRVIISKTKLDGTIDHSVALLSAGLDAATPHPSLELRRECTAQNKWERTNPGIILAHCLGKVFGVNFTSSTTSDLHTTGRSHNAALVLSAVQGQEVKAERFNVYGVLRTVLSDFDQWYVDAKRSAEAIRLAASGPKRPNAGADVSLGVLARDVVSFHYVSETEARLLYEILSGEAAALSSAGGQGVRHLQPICRSRSTPRTLNKPVNTTADCSTAREIHALWPATDKAAGHYSRPLSKGPTSFHEAELLYDYLSSVVVS